MSTRRASRTASIPRRTQLSPSGDRSRSKPGDLCYEPFLGSGTCLIAAEELGRRCFGMAQEPSYVDVVVQRWEAFTGRKAERVSAEERAIGGIEAKLSAMGSGA